MNINKKLFPWFVLFSALGLVSVAAYFSIVGISTLFAGAVVSVSIMALFLELGKISAVTFAYRYWYKCKSYLKIYLIVAITILMIITSLGISAMLMSAYQKSSIEYAVTQDKIKIIEQQIIFSQQSIDTLINLRTSQNTNQMNEFIIRNPMLFKQFQQQIADTDNNIENESKKKQSLINNINELKLGTAEKKDVQVFKFLANALNMSLDKVAKWFILMIIFIFDPLAIALILAYNVIIYKIEDESVYDKNLRIVPLEPVISTPIPAPVPAVIIEEPKAEEEIKPIIVETIELPPKVKENVGGNNNNNLSEWFRQMFKL